ncbi:unnamed protein product [Brassica rapa]|uniref:Uncharacterized protein n=1 Tax=Brassica campestris TaxID=3711 RepID=A0A8D9CJE7_BRACM|nr:unnamed protein product [Brassica rapa]
MVLGNEMCDQTPHPSQCNTLVSRLILCRGGGGGITIDITNALAISKGMEEANGNMAQGTTRRYKRRWMVRERGPGEANGTSYTSNQEYVKVGIKSHNIMIIGDQKQRQRIFHFQIRHVCGARHDDQEHGGDGEQAGGGTEIGLGQVSVLQHPRVSRHAVRPHSGRQFSGSATYTAPLTSFSETQPRSSRTAVYWHR